MIFFLIVPVWFVIVCASGVLLFFKRTRWLSAYLIVSSGKDLINDLLGVANDNALDAMYDGAFGKSKINIARSEVR
ncbi:hypothetical protein AEAC466_19165 [Asticcacaulis sp. AC466]|uniref:hypothetical protein n=1 Tax=Asticcacaulis sp. AC466 TaxID=1282362 RepID=UPI0003C3E0D9|nr:hypothetical protein [Asticcacaulis sp. AC466]ESQ82040.1 hypothetical protein AEAC466_19165 [Asticcacaulis sp. AC466]